MKELTYAQGSADWKSWALCLLKQSMSSRLILALWLGKGNRVQPGLPEVSSGKQHILDLEQEAGRTAASPWLSALRRFLGSGEGNPTSLGLTELRS